MSCDHARDDGSYVLGSLSPDERQEFEQHLASCAECARRVRELAGLPGLLARVDPDVLESTPIEEQVPDTLLPDLVHHARRAQRRRTFVTAGLGAAAALIVTLGSLTVTGALDGGRTPTASPPSPSATFTTHAGRAMVPVGHVSMEADLAFDSVAWGTRLDLSCTYAREDDWSGLPYAASYALFVHTRDGRIEQVATWRSLPGQTMQLVASTAASREDITSVEVRTSDGEPVLRLTA